MNYKQFFNKILLEAVNPTHEIPNDAINSILDDDTDPTQFQDDISVNGAPKSSVEDAKSLWEKETKINGTDSESKKASIQKIEKFLAKLDTFVKNLKNLSPEQRYTPIAILSDLVSTDPETSEKYNNIKTKLEKIKQAEELRKQAQDLENEASDTEESSTIEDSPQHKPLPNPQV